MKKLSLTLAMAGALCFGTSGFAQSASNNTDGLEKAIKALQAQIDDLKQKINNDEQQATDSASAKPASSTNNQEVANAGDKNNDDNPDDYISNQSGNNKVNYENHDNLGSQIANHQGANIINPPVVTISPYVGVPSQFDGSNLIVNNPSINDDLKLLQIRQEQRDYYRKNNQEPTVPKLIFSGYLENQINYDWPYTGSPTSDINLTGAELDTFIEANEWLSGYMSYVYDDGSGSQANRVNNSNLDLGQGFITIGDLDVSDFYSTIGQLYVPFGQYSNFMVSDPMTKTLGRTKTRALVVGYNDNNDDAISPFARVYAFQGATETNDDDANNKIENYGVNAGFQYAVEKWTGSLGASYISSIASSSGLQGNGDSSSTFNGFGQESEYENLQKDVPGMDFYGSVGFNNYTLLAEYTAATTEFDQNDLSFNNSGARPQALDLQAAYAFNYWRPSYVAVDYGKSWQALAMGLPEYDYGVTYGVSVWRHALVSLQVLRNTGYDSGTTATGWGGAAVDTDQLGETYTSATLQLDMYF